MDITDDTELLGIQLTRLQWREVRKALKTRRTYVNNGIKQGTATQQDRIMIDAIIDLIAKELDETPSPFP